MEGWNYLCALLFVGLLTLKSVVAIPKDQLYPYGTDKGDERMRLGDDHSTEEIRLRIPVAFYDDFFSSLYVNLNGHISFETEFSRYRGDLVLPLGYKLIVPFLADIDTSLNGNVYFRESADRGLLRRAEEEIQKYFKNYEDFRPRTLFIATWEDVGYFREKFDKQNTFQVVIANDGRTSFSIFLYPENGINWVASEGKYARSQLKDTPGQAGFDAGDGSRSLLLPNSGEERVADLMVLSNVGVNGVWAYKIGPTNGGNIEGPEVEEEEKEPTSCLDGGARMCSINAECNNYAEGFCCKCKKEFYGNGKNCLKKGTDTRVNGKVQGRVNGQTLEPADLHAYVQARLGRTYAAVSQIPAEYGWSMVTLNSIAGILGWTFAAPTVPKALNGFSVTGGDFNRTAKVTFLLGGEVMNIYQQVIGQDELGHMRINTQLDGNLPDLPANSRVRVEDFKEEYQRVAPGQIKSNSVRSFRIGRAVYNYRWEQTITYKECAARAWEGPIAFRLKVSRNSVAYVESEQTVRYTAANHITSIAGVADPCRNADCHPKAKCTAVGNDYRCDCEAGYEGDGQQCFDTDECAREDACDPNAECRNTEGSYECRCRRGYRGDGKTCQRDLSCADLTCDRNARCVFDSDMGRPRCECNAGYTGDGLTCEPTERRTCADLTCDPNARCINEEYGRPECACNPGYFGDGTTYCRRGRTCGDINCEPDGRCINEETGQAECECRPGYSGDGTYCRREDARTCADLRCEPQGRCIREETGRAECQCRPGYEGDGTYCRTEERRTCADIDCEPNGQCINEETGRAECQCNPGFSGDGTYCRSIERRTCAEINCEPYGRCINEETGFAECQCRPGTGGNGTYCERIQERRTCADINCEPYGRCVKEETGRAECECRPGTTGDGTYCRRVQERRTCADISCEPYGRCIKEETGYAECQCRPGTSGDGTYCRRIQQGRTCADINCEPYGRCINEETGFAECQCRPGTSGNGTYCERIQERRTCADINCEPYGRCINEETGFAECQCRPGTTGDGTYCRREERRTCADIRCEPHGRCIREETGRAECQCRPGYSGDGTYCREDRPDPCANLNCHENAECVYDEQTREHKCECGDGFSGDGLTCDETGEPDTCGRCDRRYGECLYDSIRLTFYCQCKEGFTGDGRRCYPIVEDCSIANICDPNADCIQDDRDGKYKCRCKYGYRGDGLTCEEEECNVLDNCDENADCRYDNRAQRYRCICNEGYVGDGRTCNKEEVPCNRINNCHQHAECRQVSRGVFQCVCTSGYQGDGYSCSLALDCRRDPGICDRNAECRQHRDEHVCVCSQGYRGDGRRCAPVGESDSFLMFAQGRTIMQLPFDPRDGNTGKQVMLVPGQTAIGIDSDCYTRYFYWTDVAKKVISKARLDGSDSEVIVQGLGSPEGVAVDWASGNVYWTDSGADRIEVARADGTNRKTLFNTELMNPRAIAVDPVRGVMFWTDWNRDAPKIEMASMDGSDRRVLVKDDIRLPNGLTIITEEQKLCWADAGTQHIECIGYDGRGRRVVYDLASYPFDVAFANDKFYWSDWHQRSLPNIENYSEKPNEPLDLPPGGNGRIYGLTAVKSQCPAGSNACALNSGGCRYLCLPTPGGGRTCACPDDSDDEDCKRA